MVKLNYYIDLLSPLCTIASCFFCYNSSIFCNLQWKCIA